jgi:hypothetical protein
MNMIGTNNPILFDLSGRFPNGAWASPDTHHFRPLSALTLPALPGTAETR